MEKNNKGLIVLLVVFIIISIALAGYIVYDKVIDKDSNDTKEVEKKSNKENNNKDEKEEGKEEKVEGPVETLITDEMDARIDKFLHVFPYEFNDVTVSDITEKYVMFMSYYLSSNGYEKNSVTSEELKKTIEENFGKDYKYTDQRIMSIFENEVLADYSNGVYKYNEAAAHGVCSIYGHPYDVSRERKNDIITVKRKLVYNKICAVGLTTEIFKTPELKEEYEVDDEFINKDPNHCYYYEATNQTKCEIDVEGYIKKHLDQIPTVVYEFKLENNIPVFNRVFIEK